MEVKNILKIALYILFLFVLQEVTIRYLFPLPEIENFDRSSYIKLDKSDSSRPYARHQTWHWQSSADTSAVFEHVMNRYGFRDKEWAIEKDENVPRFLFVGDSFVEGVMAKQGETIAEGFTQTADNQSIDIINAGILGVGLSEYLQLTADMVPIFKPDYVVFCIYANDLGKNAPIIPSHYLEPTFFNPYKPRVVEIIHQAKTHGPVPIRWTDSKALLPKVPSPNNPWTNKTAELSPQVTPQLAKAMQAGTFNPYRINGILLEEKYLKQAPALGEAIPFLQYTCSTFNTKPIIVYIPSRNQVTQYYYPFEKESSLQAFHDSLDLTTSLYQRHQRVIAAQCKQFQVPFIDLTPFIRQEESQGNHLYWNYDEHMKGRGYMLIGKAIRKQWETMGMGTIK